MLILRDWVMLQGKNGWLPDGRPLLMNNEAKLLCHSHTRFLFSSTWYFVTIVNLATTLFRNYYEILDAIEPSKT